MRSEAGEETWLLSVPAFVGSPGKEILLRSHARVGRWGARTAWEKGRQTSSWRPSVTLWCFLSTYAHIPFSWPHPNQPILPHQLLTFQPSSDPRGSADLTGTFRIDFCPSEHVFKLLLQELKPFIDCLPPFHLAASMWVKGIIDESKIIADEPMVISKATTLL